MNCNPKLCSLDEKQRGANCSAGTALTRHAKGKIKRDGESHEEIRQIESMRSDRERWKRMRRGGRKRERRVSFRGWDVKGLRV